MPLERDEHGQVRPLTLPEHQDRLELAIRQVEAKLLVVDPITAYLSETINTNNDASVRRATTPLTDLAQRTGTAILLVRHLNKSGELKAKYRGGGSIAFTGAARAVLVVEEHPEQPGLLVLARVKNNLAKVIPGIGYRIASDDLFECPLIVWQGVVHIDADTLLRGRDSRRDAEVREEAEELLRDLLGDGPTRVVDAKKLLTDAGISVSTIQRANRLRRWVQQGGRWGALLPVAGPGLDGIARERGVRYLREPEDRELHLAFSWWLGFTTSRLRRVIEGS